MSDNTGKAEQRPEEIEAMSADQQSAEIGEPGDSLSDLPDQLAAAQEQAEEYNNKYMRLAAEVENLRKRTVREIEHAHKFGIERFANELLAVVDSLEIGIDAGANASVESLLEGKQATLKLLIGAMSKSGVEQLDPEGEPFDPNLHEALTMQPSDTVEPGTVLNVVQKGYRLNGRLLRPARVIVSGEA